MANQLKSTKKPRKKRSNKQLPKVQNNATIIILVIAMLFSFFYLNRAYFTEEQLTYGEFFSIVANNNETQRIESVTLQQDDGVILGKFTNGTNFRVIVPKNDPELVNLLKENIDGKKFDVKAPNLLAQILIGAAPMVILIFIFWFFFIRKAAQEGKKIFSFGQSRPQLNTGSRINITFADVAGVNEAKEELQEIIEFLKDPKKFQRLGGKIPKGILLMGPPGCGKTLLAKAVSGEAGVPFFSISGSNFVEMFVGVGASRVRDLFDKAKKSAKLSGKGGIIFIDEIDAVGRQRFSGIGGGHDEREQTLNQLLSEMDGFNTQEGVILIAATNRPDVLDPALLRPGRFDRQIVVDRPDIKGREAILKVHARGIKLKPDVNLALIARRTPGFSGADLANLINEAALLAARNNKKAVELEEMEAAIERVMAGPERKSRVISDYEKSLVAYHESGHALLALLIDEVDPLHKVSIIPRGANALGYTLQLPLEDRYIITQKELLGRLVVLLGGRVSEEVAFGELSTGAQNDLEVASQIARRMVCEFGMSKKLGHLTLGHRRDNIFLGRDIAEVKNYSDETARLIDSEVKSIIDGAYLRAKSILSQHKEELKKLAEKLKEEEILDGEQVKQLVGL
ncbi:MAG: ATP-dependent zinc metalloprotease FtsH [Candidatus Kappaea frigidicola]|nr:ATP-dependent zinc metalloprotease FtsH [Candidatus Kappaea frigidicola]